MAVERSTPHSLLCTLPGRLLRRHADSLDLYEPPLALPRTQLAARWQARNQEELGHVRLRETRYKIAGATA